MHTDGPSPEGIPSRRPATGRLRRMSGLAINAGLRGGGPRSYNHGMNDLADPQTRRGWLIVVGLIVSLAAILFAWDSFVGNRFLSFHGRVVDDSGNGIAGVGIRVQITRTGWLPIPWADNASIRETTVVTDKNGSFHIAARGSAVK